MNVFFLICYILFGLVIGSFLNVVILRLPQDKSLIIDSACPKCGAPLEWRDMIPVASYLLLGGKCRCCKEPISKQYPIVEALTGVAFALIYLTKGFSIASVIYCLLACVLIVLAVIDERTFEIPRILNYCIFILSVILTLMDIQNIVGHLMGAITIGVFLFILYVLTKRHGIGLGDIKLMACAGLGLGVGKTWLAFFWGCILGSIIHSIRMRVQGSGRQLAFGPYLAAGIFLAVLCGDAFITWYLGLIGL